jgi:hypothetical protein
MGGGASVQWETAADALSALLLRERDFTRGLEYRPSLFKQGVGLNIELY